MSFVPPNAPASDDDDDGEFVVGGGGQDGDEAENDDDDALTQAQDAYFVGDVARAVALCGEAVASRLDLDEAHALAHVALRDIGVLRTCADALAKWRVDCPNSTRMLRAWVEVAYLMGDVDSLSEVCKVLGTRPLSVQEPSNIYLRALCSALVADLGATSIADFVLDRCCGVEVSSEYCDAVDALVAWVDFCCGKKQPAMQRLTSMVTGERADETGLHQQRLAAALLALCHLSTDSAVSINSRPATATTSPASTTQSSTSPASSALAVLNSLIDTDPKAKSDGNIAGALALCALSAGEPASTLTNLITTASCGASLLIKRRLPPPPPQHSSLTCLITLPPSLTVSPSASTTTTTTSTPSQSHSS
ncbi:hypothetical protein Pelo_1087 [Pelomyxa schiedti]|nr:hypothetical protein Pelo_1087 [Pelomyxa schiedti]